MTITKNGKEYKVLERAKSWAVSYKVDVLTIEYKIPKDICNNEAELREYIERKEIF